MNKKLYIETYGCQMNVADSEVVASVMNAKMQRTRSTIDLIRFMQNRRKDANSFLVCSVVWLNA